VGGIEVNGLKIQSHCGMGRPKRKRLGQNFLVDRGIAERIVGLLSDDPNRVLEIGPGRAALTLPLLDRFDRVRAVEVDPSLAQSLKNNVREPRLEIREADALADSLDDLASDGAPWQVASNLPYSVGTAILRRLLPRNDLFTRIVVMLQREVAGRVVASPGRRGHGLLALEVAAYAEARIAFEVGPGAFRPRPKVVSSVVVLELRPPSISRDEIENALRLAAHALTKPRKKLSNAVQPLCEPAALGAAGLDLSARPGEVPLKGWIQLAAGLGVSKMPD
jgi:16S rRNA (adenine1518-N6/adenine1519-N6)-dimethyltransferase